MTLTLTNSSKSTFFDCPYKYFLSYVMMVSATAEPEYFTWGKIIHRFAEDEDKGLKYSDTTDAIYKEVEAGHKDWINVELEVIDWMLRLAPHTMGGHLLKFQHDDEEFEELGIERKFSLELPCGALFQGKVDKVVRKNATGLIFNWERKTAAKTGAGYWNSLQFAGQPKGYLLATQRVWGFPATRVIYDVFKKPQVKKRLGETQEQFVNNLGNLYLLEHQKYFERDEIAFTQQQIDNYFEELDQCARLIMWCTEHAIWPCHHPSNRIGRCEFEDICDLDLSHGLPAKYRIRPAVEKHPELVENS